MPYKEETMQIGDTVWRSDFGVGKIVDIKPALTPYLVYFYKEDDRLHNGGGRGPDYHYWLCYKGSLTHVRSMPLCKLIERRQHG